MDRDYFNKECTDNEIWSSNICVLNRNINMIVIHCSATRSDIDFTEKDLLLRHRAKGMKMAGYHFYIRKDGIIKSTRPIEMIGAHCNGWNAESIGIAYEGGLNHNGIPADTRTPRQKHAMRVLIRTLKKDHDIKIICGHRDLVKESSRPKGSDEWERICPCFDVGSDKWCK